METVIAFNKSHFLVNCSSYLEFKEIKPYFSNKSIKSRRLITA